MKYVLIVTYIFLLQISILGSIKNELNKVNHKNVNKDAMAPVKSRKATKALQQHMKTVAQLELNKQKS